MTEQCIIWFWMADPCFVVYIWLYYLESFPIGWRQNLSEGVCDILMLNTCSFKFSNITSFCGNISKFSSFPSICYHLNSPPLLFLSSSHFSFTFAYRSRRQNGVLGSTWRISSLPYWIWSLKIGKRIFLSWSCFFYWIRGVKGHWHTVFSIYLLSSDRARGFTSSPPPLHRSMAFHLRYRNSKFDIK